MQKTLTHDFVAAAAALAPQIREARDELETDRRLPASLVEELNQACLLQLSLPRSMGGPESDPLTSFRVIEELSRVDGSVGWCAMMGVGTTPAASTMQTGFCVPVKLRMAAARA